MAALRSWLKKESLWLYASSNLTPTHVFLDGGKACIPLARVPELLEVCAACVAAGDPPCLVERLAASRENFRMFMDLDFKSNQAHGSGLSRVLDVLLESLPLPLQKGTIIVCRRSPAESSSNPESEKQGLHLIWEDVPATSAQAVAWVRVTLSNIASLFPDESMDWRSVLDCSVYRNSGLRVVFAPKGRGDRSTYVPWMVVSRPAAGELSKVSVNVNVNDPLMWLRRCSIILLTAGVKPEPLDTGVEPVVESVVEPRTEVDSEAAASSIDRLLSRYEAYRGCRWLPPVKICDKAVVVPLESKYCHNIGREHRNNRVYLLVTRTGVYQACHCRCPDKTCKTFRKQLAGPGNSVSRKIFLSLEASGSKSTPAARCSLQTRPLSQRVASLSSRILAQRTRLNE